MGNRLREIRQERGMSLEDLARLSGVSKSTISRIELGESEPTQSVMCKICKALGLKLDEVFRCN